VRVHVYQLFMSVGGVKQIDLTAYIESDDCKHALHEYSTDGLLVREIELPSDVTEPQDAVQMGRRFVVTHAGTSHVIGVARRRPGGYQSINQSVNFYSGLSDQSHFEDH